jgi:hypothetical protein
MMHATEASAGFVRALVGVVGDATIDPQHVFSECGT